MDDLYGYLSLCLQHGWLYLTAVPLVLDTILKYALPRLHRRMGRLIPPKGRKEVEVMILALGIFFAGYLTYENEHQQRQQIERYRETALVDMADQPPGNQAEVDQLRTKVQTYEEKTAEQTAKQWPALTDGQIEEWSRELAPYKVAFVSITYGDDTSQAFRDSLSKVFKKAGWPAPLIMNGGGGVGITFKSNADEASAPMLQSLLESVSSEVKWDMSDEVVAGVQIDIGQRPVSSPDAPISPE